MAFPAYNGGLFDADAHPFLNEKKLSDWHLARVIDRLGRAKDPETPTAGLFRVDYRDLAIQHLGGIYEGLLELHPRWPANGCWFGARRFKGVREEIVKPESEGSPSGYDRTDIAYPPGSVYLITDKGERAGLRQLLHPRPHRGRHCPRDPRADLQGHLGPTASGSRGLPRAIGTGDGADRERLPNHWPVWSGAIRSGCCGCGCLDPGDGLQPFPAASLSVSGRRDRHQPIHTRATTLPEAANPRSPTGSAASSRAVCTGWTSTRWRWNWRSWPCGWKPSPPTVLSLSSTTTCVTATA